MQFEIRSTEGSISLTLHNSEPGEFPYLETPGDYTTSELRDRAAHFGFDFRLSSEELIRAQLNLRLARFNLVPHISAGSVLSIGAYGTQGVITSVGELVPFLFPTHWIRVTENAQLLNAQEYAFALVKLNSMQVTESLGMALGRDQHLWTQLKEDRALHFEIENEIQLLEQLGKLQPGSLLAIQSAANNLDQAIANLESIIPLESTALSTSVGFINPNAITTLTVDILGDIEAPPELNITDLELRAVRASPEIRQIEALIAASKTAKRSRAFQWTSPQGDPSGALGIGLSTYIDIGSSHLRDLYTAKDRIHALLLHKILDAIHDYRKSLDSHQFALKGVAIQTRRIQEARNSLQNHSINDIHDLRDALQLLVVNHANVLIAQYAWYNSLSKLNRLLREGPYSDI